MNDAAVSVTGKLLWSPDPSARTTGQVPEFAGFVKDQAGMDWGGDFPVSYTHLTLPTRLMV